MDLTLGIFHRCIFRVRLILVDCADFKPQSRFAPRFRNVPNQTPKAIIILPRVIFHGIAASESTPKKIDSPASAGLGFECCDIARPLC